MAGGICRAFRGRWVSRVVEAVTWKKRAVCFVNVLVSRLMAAVFVLRYI